MDMTTDSAIEDFFSCMKPIGQQRESDKNKQFVYPTMRELFEAT